MKFRELLEVSKFDKYNLEMGTFTKKEIEESYSNFLDMEVKEVKPVAHSIRKFLGKKVYSVIVVVGNIYFKELDKEPRKNKCGLEAKSYAIDEKETVADKLLETRYRNLFGKYKGVYKWDLAVDWFNMSNDDFFEKYTFNWTPHEEGELFDICKKYLSGKYNTITKINTISMDLDPIAVGHGKIEIDSKQILEGWVKGLNRNVMRGGMINE